MPSIQIIGLDDLRADFERLAKAQSTKALRRATLAGSTVIRDGARARAKENRKAAPKHRLRSTLPERCSRLGDGWRARSNEGRRRFARTTRFTGALSSLARSIFSYDPEIEMFRSSSSD